jgi:ABC-type lipoprotein release transport system permease subunit
MFSHKKHNIINIISLISVLGIMASTAALIIVLSVANGMQDLVVSNFNRFNPQLKIEPQEGKVFSIENEQFSILDLENVEGVKVVEQVLCDLALVTYNEKQTLATVYGVSGRYPKVSGIAETIIDGNFNTEVQTGVVLGNGIAGLLGINLNGFVPLKLYYPKRNKKSLANPMDAFQVSSAPPIGVFATFTPYDEQALFVPVSMVKELFEYDNETSFIAIYVDENAPLEKVQKKVEQLVGDSFSVKNQMQQEVLLFKTIQMENFVVYLILGFILVIATFNIIGILSMLIIEKKEDISILHTLGASKTLIKKLFLMVGAMIGIFGGFLGIFIGLILCLIQQYFGVITFGSPEASFIISAYPVALDFKDFAVTFCLIIFISIITSSLALKGLKNSYLTNKY